MKQKFYFFNNIIFLLLLALLARQTAFAQNTFPSSGAAGIGTLTPGASSLLDITSTTKGILIPRMNITQRNAIVTPATGLLIYQTNSTPGFYYYSGTAWVAVAPKGVSKSLNNLIEPTAVNVSLLPGTNGAIDLGSSSSQWRNGYLSGTLTVAGDASIRGLTVGRGGGIGQNQNTAIGVAALFSNNSGYSNVANGYQALYKNFGGYYNTATGSQALYLNTGGYSNTANGCSALFNNNTGNVNTAIGSQSLYNNNSGSANTANGYSALFSNTTGYSNVAIGNSSLYSNSTSSNLVAVGDSALYKNTGMYNTALGSKSLYNNTNGSYNTAGGYRALYSNGRGHGNVANGYQALYSNDSGGYNVANGFQALYSTIDGGSNTAVGSMALFSNTHGNWNTASGYGALYSNTAGFYNTADGNNALGSNNGFHNTATGAQALRFNTTGSSNSAFGVGAGYGNYDGSDNTYIGDSATSSSGSLSNATAIGALASVGADNSMVLGSINGINNATSSVNVGIGVTTPASSLHIKGKGSTSSTSSLQVENLGSSTPMLYVRDDGNIGIGTSTPLRAKLETVGSVGNTLAMFGQNTSGVSFTGAWPGIWFNSYYNFGNKSMQSGYGGNIGLDPVTGRIVINTGNNPGGADLTATQTEAATFLNNGNLGLGLSNPSYKLQLSTDAAAKPGTGTWTIASDERLKKNITPFKDGLKVLDQINPVWFEYNGKADLPENRKYVGVIAQQVQQVAPYMVSSFINTDTTGKSVQYLDYNPNALFYILVNSVKELSSANAELKAEVNELKQMVLAHQLQENKTSINLTEASIEQNIPNPFNNTTTIYYYLPNSQGSPHINFYSSAGALLKSVKLMATGKGMLEVKSGELPSATYRYALVVDGKVIDSKQMALLK